MATVISSKKSTVGSPYCYYTLTMTYSNRTATSVKVSWELTAKLASSSSTMGYSLTAYVYAGGYYQSKSLKGTTTWSGTSAYTISGSFTVSGLSATTSSISTALKVVSGAPHDACQLDKYSGSNLAIATVPKYTVKYSANGGSGAPSSQTKYKDVTLKLSTTKPTRTGYTFQGWGTTSTDTTVNYAAGASYTSNASITLYAIWKAKTYTISYDANGGTGAPSSQTKTYGVTLKLSTTVPTRADLIEEDTITTYTFKGWATSSKATSATYKAGSSYTTNAAATLYAVWAENKTITKFDIIYNSTGGSSVTSQTKDIGVNLILTDVTPTRHGYTFVGWNTVEDGSGTSYESGATYTTDDDLILYAIWTPWVHTVNFDANGGLDTPTSFTKTTKVDVSISEDKPTRSGYVFYAWNTQSNGSGDYYYPNDSYDYTQNGGTVTLYAIWISTDILIYMNGNCKAVHFEEGADCLSFVNNGTVKGIEFIEGSALNINETAFYITEIKEGEV